MDQGTPNTYTSGRSTPVLRLLFGKQPARANADNAYSHEHLRYLLPSVRRHWRICGVAFCLTLVSTVIAGAQPLRNL